MTHRHDILNLGQNFHEEPTYGTTTANVNQSVELQDLSHFLGFVSFAKIPFPSEDTRDLLSRENIFTAPQVVKFAWGSLSYL